MGVIQISYCFDLDDHTFIYNDVGIIVANLNPIVHHPGSLLLRYSETGLS